MENWDWKFTSVPVFIYGRLFFGIVLVLLICIVKERQIFLKAAIHLAYEFPLLMLNLCAFDVFVCLKYLLGILIFLISSPAYPS